MAQVLKQLTPLTLSYVSKHRLDFWVQIYIDPCRNKTNRSTLEIGLNFCVISLTKIKKTIGLHNNFAFTTWNEKTSFRFGVFVLNIFQQNFFQGTNTPSTAARVQFDRTGNDRIFCILADLLNIHFFSQLV